MVAANKLEKQIGCVKYTLFCFNLVTWILGAALFGVTVWIRAEPGFDDWINKLQAQTYFIGIYILIGTSVVIMAISFLGCLSALMENRLALIVFIGTQIFGFILSVVGSAILMDYSTMNSSLQPIIRNTMKQYVMTSESPGSSAILKMIQENIGCCGADGADDYINLRQPLPAECRDTVTGNAFFYGCVDELTWFIEDKSAWVAGLSMAVAFLCVINGILSLVLIQAIEKEEDKSTAN